jgi:hypothetical protein
MSNNTHQNLLPFNTLLRYAIYWFLLNKIISTFIATNSIAQLQTMFALNSANTYLIIAAILVIIVINIFGLIANPIVASYNKHITWKTIIPESAKFFFSYIGLTLLISLTLFGILVLSYFICTLIVGIFGYINHAYFTTVFSTLIPLVPSLISLFSGIFFIFAPYALVNNQTGAWPALLTSGHLVKQNLFGVVVRLGLLLIILALLSSILQFIPLFGWSLAIMISNITLTVFNYTLYLHLTTNK